MNTRTTECSSPWSIFRPGATAPPGESVSFVLLSSREQFSAGVSKAAADMATSILSARRAHNHDVATAAYYLSAQRGFEPGHELEDWLAAEAQVTGGRQKSTSE